MSGTHSRDRATQEAKAESRCVFNIHEDIVPCGYSMPSGYLSTMLTPSWRKKRIFRGAIDTIDSIFGQCPEQIS